jgi:hypothetical protein
MSAREIANELELPKSDVNSILYQGKNDTFAVDELRKWTVRDGSVEYQVRPSSHKPGSSWSEQECFLAVGAYDEIDCDRSLNKSAVFRKIATLTGRTPKSIEFKLQNVSAFDPRPRRDKPIAEAPHGQALLGQVFASFWANRDEARARYVSLLNGPAPVESVSSTDNRTPRADVVFPDALLDWKGTERGGVTKLLDDAEGRPLGSVITTELVRRLREWACELVGHSCAEIRSVLLVGGPGNGKTQALEEFVLELDRACGAPGSVLSSIQAATTADGRIPRKLELSVKRLDGSTFVLRLVQEGSIAGDDSVRDPAALLKEDLRQMAAAQIDGEDVAYLGCFNRGIIDRAGADRSADENVEDLVDVVLSASGFRAGSDGCWPTRRPWLAVWPMDVESLVRSVPGGPPSAIYKILAAALDESAWARAECPNPLHCPFHRNRDLLVKPALAGSLVSVLGYYEIVAGKRLGFRDLFSIVSEALAGYRSLAARDGSLCQWAARQWREIDSTDWRASRDTAANVYMSLWMLLSQEYQQKLFWDWTLSESLEQSWASAIDQLEHEGLPARAVLSCAAGGTGPSAPGTSEQGQRIFKQIVTSLDPVRSPIGSGAFLVDRSLWSDSERAVISTISSSIGAAREIYRSFEDASPALVGILEILDALDRSAFLLATKKPTISQPALALASVFRGIASRLLYRQIGVGRGVVANGVLLADFESLCAGGVHAQQRCFELQQDLNKLLSNGSGGNNVAVSLGTTFGEPVGLAERRVTLRVPKGLELKIELPARDPSGCKPWIGVPIVTSGQSLRSGHALPMTFALFKALVDTRSGLRLGSVSSEVRSMLDGLGARFAANLAHDRQLWPGAYLTIDGKEMVEPVALAIEGLRNA